VAYFITGATGFVGGAIADMLLDEGHDLVVLARTPSKAEDLADRGAEVVDGDITEKESMRDAMDGTDGVYHIAAWYKVGAADDSKAERINVGGTRNVLELVDELDIPKAVYTSSIAINSDTKGQVVDESYRFEGPHQSEYDRTKWTAHYEVVEPMAADGVPVVSLLPGAIYGPGDTSQIRKFLRMYLKGILPAVPQRTAMSFGHIEDTARAHLQAMEDGEPGEEYIVTGPHRTVVELFETAADITGIPAPRGVPPEVFTGLSIFSGFAEPFVDMQDIVDLPDFFRSETLRVMAGSTYLGDNSKAVEELGLEHRPFEDGLRKTIAHEMRDLGDRVSRRAAVTAADLE
jgi:nucleoside-diphosphate-sugar epimerase